jgi:hypothetical protein
LPDLKGKGEYDNQIREISEREGEMGGREANAATCIVEAAE